ncbi:hypothetical protein NQ176_g10228 [Zarea fungicola]|uniref:Uncharacterized protein n=1 Tax=Zarea fungicola TaxID=93591 RepID=A0ACC1MI30_9HYPO|nr:hypothetical protein NQ176_g10228 [Lecanicillium fungicola]
MEGSESEGRGFISGDEDDTDFKSDTLYDSLRTVASSRTRAVDTPLESVYDDSPSSTASNGKSRRLSIHEMLGKAWDGGDRITEEDEALQTPVRLQSTIKAKSPASHDANNSPSGDQLRLVINPIHSSFPSRDFARMSLEDDLDDDWARYEDDEADSHISPLSAPSKSSLNAKGMNPNVRLALANMGNGTSDENTPTMDRPLSNIFDWSEPSTQDKHDSDRHSGRPQTAYGKQTLDPRSGRSANRRGPAPAHVRSQSVPVVHDAAEEQQKITGAKYGTWGLGTKTVSEDWDEDFEFGSSAGNGDRGNESMFAVPESIRASQPSVKAHSGQIRELSLLVNDLKRLCRHARDMGLLEGSQKALWKEAEGVIALASPDDETMEDDADSNPSVDLDAFDSKVKQGDQRPKTPQAEKLDFGSPKLEPSISKTAVVRERHSPRRRSVFSPDDDIFGGADSSADKKASTSYKKSSQPLPRTPERIADVNGVVRTVMEAMQHHTHSDTVQEAGKPSRKVQFDTNSLKALVRRSGELRDALADIIRRTDQLTQSPARPLRHDRDRGPDSSPAFTRVFDDPGSSPPRRVTRSRGNNSLKQTTSPDSSPPPQLERRFPLMTVR